MRNRLAAVLLVGVTGYGCGVIFVFHGAPDLALTQFLVETLTLVIFVLVLRTLPAEADRAQHQPESAAAGRAGAGGRRAASPRSRSSRWPPAPRGRSPTLLPDAAYYRGHGSNTVNVLLVDIRAWDTMGEISVLLVAATGVASMVFRHRRFGSAPRVADAGQPDIGRHSGRCDEPRGRRHHLAARQRAARPAVPVAGARGRDADHLPAHHGAVGVLLLRRPQHPRRRFRGRPDRRARPGAALPGRRPLRTRRGTAAGRGQGARRRPGPLGGHRGDVAAARRAGAVVGGVRVRRPGARPRQVRHRAVLRPRRLPDRRRPGPRRAAQPRRPRRRRDGAAVAR